ncbi:MAG: hypothetical protein IT348_16140, partial [Candidatus Eisenbacteria bacterium]|nr:hypothetical protein [Candidatus Eisenbacteria bacterium]
MTPAVPAGPDPEARRISRGLFVWLMVIAFGGLVSTLFSHPEAAFFFAAAGVLILAQATDAAVAVSGYREWVQSNVPRGEFRGRLFRAIVRALVPMTGVLFFLGIGAWAQSENGQLLAHRQAAGWSYAAAVICALLVWRPAADLVTRLCFRSGAVGRTRRLTARIVVMMLLLPVPMQLLFPELMAALKATEEPLATPGGLIGQMIGEIALAAAGVGLLVRRNWSETLERLGMVAMKPAHYGVALVGLVAIIVLNTGAEW